RDRFEVTAIRDLIEPTLLPEPTRALAGVLGRGEELRVHQERVGVAGDRDRALAIVRAAGELEDPAAAVPIAVPGLGMTVAQALGVDRVGDRLGVARDRGRAFRSESARPYTQQGLSRIVEVLLEVAELAAL